MPKKTDVQLKKEKEAELLIKKYAGKKPVYDVKNPKPKSKPLLKKM